MRRLLALPLLACACQTSAAATKDGGGTVIPFPDAAPSDAGVADAASDVTEAGTAFTVALQVADGGAFHSVWGSGPNDVHVVGDNGMMYDFDGSQWIAVAGQTGASMGGVWGTSATDVYAVGTLAAGATGIILHNDGSGWVTQMEVAAGLNAVWGTGGTGGTVYAVGLGGHLYTNTAGAGWTDPGHLPPNVCVTGQGADQPILWSVWGNNATFVDVAADVDTFFRYDGMSSWLYSCDPVDRTRAYRAVWGPPTTGSAASMFLGANYYGVWWDTSSPELLQLNEERDTPDRVNQSIWGIWGTASDSIVFVGDAGRIMSWDGGPNGLKKQPSPTSVSLYGVWGTSLADVWIAGDQGTLLHGKVVL